MTLFRRIGSTAVLALSLSSLANAQAPSGRALSWDVGALGSSEIRFSVEPVRLGHFSFLATFSKSDNSRGGDLPAEVTINRVGSPQSFDHVSGAEYSFDISGRYYTSPVRVSRVSYGAYFGASVGAHQRTLSQWCFNVACPDLGFETQASGIEPATEVGVRFLAQRLIVDVGMRARLVTFNDMVGNYRSGDLDFRPSLSLGFSW